MVIIKRITLLVLASMSLLSLQAAADVRLPHVFGDQMVLQQGMEIPVWGWADAKERITLRLGSRFFKVQADDQGKWKIKLPALSAGGPLEMEVVGKNRVLLKNILVGEVWLCSGQSNMEWPVDLAEGADEAVPDACDRQLRLFHIPRRASGLPLADLEARWRLATPDTVATFSAVAYYYGTRLRQKLGVPVGLISAAWGGTRIEPWTPFEGLLSVPKLAYITQKMQRQYDEYKHSLRKVLRPLKRWVSDAREALAQDKPVPIMPPYPDHPFCDRHQPTALYNGMIHGIVPFAIRGAIWYQGEQNLGEGSWYHAKMRALIRGWRWVWKQGEFPFYYVQLAPFCYWGLQPDETPEEKENPYALPEIWEAQVRILKMPNTGMVVTTDIGDLIDIHPKNKKDVGERLALWALSKTYGGKDLVCSGPLFRSMAVEENKIRIRFDHAGSGLATGDGNPPSWFEIAGKDGIYHQAGAKIEENAVVVWSEKVCAPVSVRFGWHQGAQPNLINREGLPASPFRTLPPEAPGEPGR